MLYYYGFTLTKVRGERKLSYYEDYLAKLNLEYHVKVYEEDKGLHLHCLIRHHGRLTQKQCKLYPHGWSFRLAHLKSFSDVGNWVHYCLKHYGEGIYDKHLLEEQYQDYLAEPPLDDKSQSCPDSPDSMAPLNFEPEEDDVKKYNYPQFDIRKALRSAANEMLDSI